MISDGMSKEAYVWVWLPKTTEPVVAGRISNHVGQWRFNYGKSYLERSGAIPLYEPELPLQPGLLPLLPELSMPNCLRDASPDAWGRRVILNRMHGLKGAGVDTSAVDELTYLLESGSDRMGALDFQHSPTEYQPRISNSATLEELLASAGRVERGEPLSAELDQALHHGSSIGGARPKALLESDNRKYVAKFSSSADLYPVVKAEFVAMRLASLAGLDVAKVDCVQASGRDVLLVERFDRLKTPEGWQRRAVVSALTLFGLDEMMARYASYETLAEIIRHRFENPAEALRELFGRMVFNILCGNTDDHARNHAAFWNGCQLALTPAYDICPQARSGNEASQAMLVQGNHRESRLGLCVVAAPQFLLGREEALAVIEHQKEIIEREWNGVCDEARLGMAERNFLWQRQFLNPSIFHQLEAKP